MNQSRKIQFIKNMKGSPVCKPFRKYNVIRAWYCEELNRWVHYTKFGIHFIPPEYVKLYNH